MLTAHHLFLLILYDKRTPEYHQRDVTGNCCKEVANKAGLENGKILFLLFQTLFFNHKTTKTIAGEQSSIVFKSWLDPYIVNRILEKYFEGEDDQDVQSDMKNKGDFPGQEDLQKNEKGELLPDILNDEFGKEDTSLSKGTEITLIGSEQQREMSSKEEKQEIEFLKVAT